MKLLNKITNIYLYSIFIIFILLIDKTGYHNILYIKWNIYVYTTVIYILAILLTTVFKIIRSSISIKDFKFNKIHLFALIYIFILILSCLLSPYKNYNLLIGSTRVEGLIVNIIYVISFMVISLTYKYDKKIIYAILLPSIIMALMIMIQRFIYNPFSVSKDVSSEIFYGTIGNIDTIGLLYTIYIILGISLYIFTNKVINRVYIIISIISSLIVMAIINVLNMYVTLLIILILLFPFVILSSKYLKRYLMITISIISICIFKYYNYWYFIILVIILISLFLILIRNTNYNILNKKNVIKCFIGLLLILLGIIISIYFINFKNGLLFEVHNILHGNIVDSYGTYRIFLWKRTFGMINSNNILLGTGVDTYYIAFSNKYFDELVMNGYVNINDTASNFYLTRLINIGVIGLSSFLLFVGSVVCLERKNKCSDATLICLFITIISYLIQGLFNLEVVIVTPIFYCILAMYTSLKISKVTVL